MRTCIDDTYIIIFSMQRPQYYDKFPAYEELHLTFSLINECDYVLNHRYIILILLQYFNVKWPNPPQYEKEP
jgi:hypothetical protein